MFDLNERQLLAQKLFREFADKEVRPIAAEIDEEERFPTETVEKMHKYGMMGIPFSQDYNGAGADYMSYILCVEELSKACATTGVIVSAHTSLCSGPIDYWGTEEQKQKYLIPLNTDKIGAFGLTEPNAGTDAAEQQSVAVKKGDHYILNGSKIFITNSGDAEVYVIMAMTDKSAGTRGISSFIVEKGWEGFSFGPKEKKMGIRGSSTRELIFDNVKIPEANLLGKEGQGFKIAMHTLDGGRIGIAAQALGIAQGAFDEAVKYVSERKQFGRAISAFQNTQFKLAEMHAQIEAARLLVYKAAMCKQEGKPYAVEAATAKLFASETAMSVTTKVVQLFGGYGFIREFPVERMMRDAKITEIYEGTSEVQKMVISAALLKGGKK